MSNTVKKNSKSDEIEPVYEDQIFEEYLALKEKCDSVMNQIKTRKSKAPPKPE